MARRDALGRIAPGSTLNPGGRSKQVTELLDLARAATPKAIALAETYLDDEELDPRVRLDAAKFLASYGLGKPPALVPPDDDDKASRPLAGLPTAVLERLSDLGRLSEADLIALARGDGSPDTDTTEEPD